MRCCCCPAWAERRGQHRVVPTASLKELPCCGGGALRKSLFWPVLRDTGSLPCANEPQTSPKEDWHLKAPCPQGHGGCCTDIARHITESPEPLPPRMHIFSFPGVSSPRSGTLKHVKEQRTALRSMPLRLAFCSQNCKELETGFFFSHQQALFLTQLLTDHFQ